MSMKQELLDEYGYSDKGWTVDYSGRLICPHHNAIEPDLREGHADCGCVSPIEETLF